MPTARLLITAVLLMWAGDVAAVSCLDDPEPPVAPPCYEYWCSELKGTWLKRALPSGSACSDGHSCTYGDKCNGTGTCTGTAYTLTDPLIPKVMGWAEL
jgi:hypothetical protein